MQEQFNTTEFLTNFVEKNVKIIFGVGTILIFGIAAYFVIDYKRSTYRQQAYDYFVELKKFVDAPVTSKDDDDGDEGDHKLKFSSEVEKWSRVREQAKKGYDLHGQHGFGVNFPIYEVNALLKLGKNEEAIEVLGQTINKLSSGPVKDLMKAKLALIKMDSTSQEVQSRGLKELEAIANSNNFASDMAYYRLGEYFWIKGDTTEAKSIWNSLVSEFSSKAPRTPDRDDVSLDGNASFSPWAEKAREKLKLTQ